MNLKYVSIFWVSSTSPTEGPGKPGMLFFTKLSHHAYLEYSILEPEAVSCNVPFLLAGASNVWAIKNLSLWNGWEKK